MPDGYYATFSAGCFEGVDKKTLSAAMARLRQKKFVEYGRGLWSEDGIPAGAGYRLTQKGKQKARLLSMLYKVE